MDKGLFAKRVSDIPPSATLSIAEAARRMRASGERVIELSGGEPDFATPLHIVEAVEKAIRDGYTKYTVSSGILELREAISRKYELEQEVKYDPVSEVLVTPGAKQGLFYAIMALVNSGDEVLIPDPCWISYEPIVRLAEGKMIRVATSEKDDFILNANELEKSITKKSKILILTNPNNPTGSVIDIKNIEEIARVVKKHNLIVVSDEIYEKIVFENAKCKSIATINGMKEQTVIINGFSKAYAMTGWRLGYVLAPSRIMEKIAKLQQHSATCVTAFVQKGGIAALDGPQEVVGEMVRKYQRRRDLLLSRIGQNQRLSCFKPKGAFYLFMNVKRINNDSAEFADQLIKTAGITTVPGAYFGPAGEGYLRISFAVSDKVIEEAINKIKEI